MILQRVAADTPKVIKRNIGILAPAFQTAKDPIQQLFVDKIREYKSKSAGGKIVDAGPEVEKERKAELERIAKQCNIVGDPKQFPTFKFADPDVQK